MLAIVTEHFLRQSHLAYSAHQVLNVFFGSGARICVNVFVMMGSWFLVDSRFKAERIVRLYFEVVSYSIPLTLCMFAMGQHGGMRELFQGLVPFFGRSVWFASAYISLMALSPFLNQVFCLPLKKQRLLMSLILVFYVVVSTIPSFTPLDYIADFSWFCALYLLIGWVRRKSLLHLVNIKWTALGGCIVVYFFLCAMAVSPRLQWIGNYWLDNIKSLPNVFCAFLAFVFFIKLKIGSISIINIAAKSVFAVYIVHQIPAFIHFEWRTLLKVYDPSDASPCMYALSVLTLSVAIFVSISAIDALRRRIAEPIYMRLGVTRKLVNAIENLYAD